MGTYIVDKNAMRRSVANMDGVNDIQRDLG
jgi:hypothetical protein